MSQIRYCNGMLCFEVQCCTDKLPTSVQLILANFSNLTMVIKACRLALANWTLPRHWHTTVINAVTCLTACLGGIEILSQSFQHLRVVFVVNLANKRQGSHSARTVIDWLNDYMQKQAWV